MDDHGPQPASRDDRLTSGNVRLAWQDGAAAEMGLGDERVTPVEAEAGPVASAVLPETASMSGTAGVATPPLSPPIPAPSDEPVAVDPLFVTRPLDLVSVNGRRQVSAAKVKAPRTRPRLVTLTLALADLLSVTLAVGGAVLLRYIFDGEFFLIDYAQLWPLLGLFIAGYALAGLYPNLPFAPAEELRKLTMVSAMICLTLGMLTFLTREAETYSRGALLMAFALLCLLVPLGRAVARLAFSHRSWWGHSVVVLGSGQTATRIVRHLKRQPQAGLSPAGVLTDDPSPRGRGRIGGVPVLGGLNDLASMGPNHGIRYAVIAMCDIPTHRIDGLVDRLDEAFEHVLIVPDIGGMSTLWVDSVDVGGALGLRVKHRLTDPTRRAIKRSLDLALIAMFSPLLVPLFAALALLVKLTSRGPVFYSQERVGRNGIPFRALKFRSMHADADAQLEACLRSCPERRRQWERCQKLDEDPRITPLGRWLRRTSLDELPQLINVLRDEMSLVGPRPVVRSELVRYGRFQKIMLKAKPGITGLWQVSGRNRLTYDERVAYDVYYVRNWSVWLDLYVLARTVIPVMRGDGAV